MKKTINYGGAEPTLEDRLGTEYDKIEAELSTLDSKRDDLECLQGEVADAIEMLENSEGEAESLLQRLK